MSIKFIQIAENEMLNIDHIVKINIYPAIPEHYEDGEIVEATGECIYLTLSTGESIHLNISYEEFLALIDK